MSKQELKAWWKDFRIPKTILGIGLLAAGVYFKNEQLVHWGLAILGVGLSSKFVKASQGNPVFNHERHLIKLFTNKEK